jgi:predicted nucleic acid-binding protein
MKALLDTSTLIAAMLPDHVHHAHALPWLSQAKQGAFAAGRICRRPMRRSGTNQVA